MSIAIPDVIIYDAQRKVYTLRDELVAQADQREVLRKQLAEHEKEMNHTAKSLAEVCYFLDEVDPSGDPWPHIEEVLGEHWKSMYPYSDNVEMVRNIASGSRRKGYAE